MAPRISFVDPISTTEATMLAELDRHREGTPQSSAP